ncbi:MAG: hypothetical protein A3F09_02325 [Chlamydiae bacterium RIFCSPHIGHO2_12_FULL_49_11]|nr:MAG: hypothetical protein A3F09_02325 [Chlamydiae bacterium RIFCSPHIGHO2_12_FULL_49_11]
MIKIREKITPFTHEIGSTVWVPYTDCFVRVYPAKLFVGDRGIDLPVKGPVKKFTVLLNLEQGRVEVFGEGRDGFFQLNIFGENNRLVIRMVRGEKKEWTLPCETILPFPKEKLLLGSLKKLEWEKVASRFDLREWYPILFLMGQMGPKAPHPLDAAPAHLLGYLSSFLKAETGDVQFQGLDLRPLPVPLFSLYHAFFQSIRNRFIVADGKKIELLPKVVSPFDRGRMVGVHTDFGTLDMQWSGYKLKTCIFRCTQNAEIVLVSKLHKTCGVRLYLKQKRRLFVLDRPFELKAGSIYLLDKFES